MAIRLSAALALSLVTLALLGCPQEGNNGRGPVEADISTVSRPEWVDSGQHPSFPPDQFISATMAGDGGLPPGREQLVWRLCERLQVLVADRIAEMGDAELAATAHRGLWVGLQHFPADHFRHFQWTDGFVSMGVCGISRTELAAHARSILVRMEPFLGREHPPWTLRDNALDDVQDRVRFFAEGTDEVVLRILSGVDGDTSFPFEMSMMQTAGRLLRQAMAFREFVGFRILGGASQRLELGRPVKPLECHFVFMGQPAVGLPLKPILSGLRGSGPIVADSIGVGTIQFDGSAHYTGQAHNPVGFDIGWDLLLPSGETGIEVPPFTTEFTLPAIENTAVVVNVTEKISNQTIADGPIRQALLSWLRDAGVLVIDGTPRSDEERFVLEIGGVISVMELDRAGVSGVRQVQARGTLLLRTWQGPVLATVNPIEGLGRYVMPVAGRDSEEARVAFDVAAQAALADAWAVWRASVSSKFREAFPPIFLPSTERGPQPAR